MYGGHRIGGKLEDQVRRMARNPGVQQTRAVGRLSRLLQTHCLWCQGTHPLSILAHLPSCWRFKAQKTMSDCPNLHPTTSVGKRGRGSGPFSSCAASPKGRRDYKKGSWIMESHTHPYTKDKGLCWFHKWVCWFHKWVCFLSLWIWEVIFYSWWSSLWALDI